MAEDGLLLNFELPTTAFTAPPPSRAAFKGGSWKDRLTARKSAEYGRKKAQERAAGNVASSHVVEDGVDPTISEARQAKRPRTGNHPGTGPHPAAKLRNGEFISSLFTYNPASKTRTEEPPQKRCRRPGRGDGHLLQKMHIKAPTAIQRKAIQLLCAADTDAFIQAQTGSGKTLAYLLPIVERICAISRAMKDGGKADEFSRDSGLFAIVLAPTRELSRQISSVLDNVLACCHWIVAGTVIGGEKKKSEKARLRRGLNILVATPGRLADHLNHTEVLDVSRVRWLVLDEGDRLMELGFEEDLQKIISVLNLRATKTQAKRIPGLPDRRTTVLCSATIKATVEHLQSISLKDPVSIAVDPAEAPTADDATTTTTEAAFSAPAQLKQSYAVVPAKQRLVTLVAMLRQTFRRKGSVMKCIIFISCADSVDFHFSVLTQDFDRHAKSTSSEDQQTPEQPSIAPDQATSRPPSYPHEHPQKPSPTPPDAAVLVCTDVASRGLDLPNVDLVIEYDAPFSSDDHLHRIGRTARAGRAGRAIIFLQPGCEEGYIDILCRAQPQHTLTRHDAEDLLRKGFPSSPSAPHSWSVRATDFQLDAERWTLAHPPYLEQARRAYQAHIRAYATHVAAERHIFDLRAMHLGHLAKAFALRDRPASLRVPGLRPGASAASTSTSGARASASVAGASVASGRGAGGKRTHAAANADDEPHP
ncbi:hypothetical protein MRB53_040788 [Persea americana]|nr:hypothetical protein MRB53_040788 [Persea americana]